MILNIYKEKGWTSFDVVAKIRGMLGGKKHKVGHAGTLDPLAEGVLIVLTEEDTKKQAQFMDMKKEYECEIGFG
ncbi:tRNA pseudouridine(55) synthase, partial [Patescibacteria group bacterium]